jgi:hypothetical protein
MTGPLAARGVNGQVTFDGGTVTITRKGALGRLTVGKGMKQIPVTAITAVQIKPAGLVRGFIQFTIPGGNERRSKFGSQSTDAAKDENSVLFSRSQQAAFQQIADAITVTVRSTGQPERAPLAEELARLAGLHQQGHLSDDEYAAAKARLLG